MVAWMLPRLPVAVFAWKPPNMTDSRQATHYESLGENGTFEGSEIYV